MCVCEYIYIHIYIYVCASKNSKDDTLIPTLTLIHYLEAITK